MADAGFLTTILGGVVRLTHFAQMLAIEKENALPCDPVRRIAALAVMVEEDVVRLTTRLRLSNSEAAALMSMGAYRPLFERDMDERNARMQLYRLGEGAYRNRVLMAWARSGDSPSDKKWWKLYTLPERWTTPEFPLKGQDLLAAGRQKGPEIGEILQKLETHWIETDFTKTREDLLSVVRK
jgi:poly(A) polymerase